jgi:hypothetical protein
VERKNLQRTVVANVDQLHLLVACFVHRTATPIPVRENAVLHEAAPTGVLSSTHHGKVVAILNFHSQLITRGFHPSLSIQAA